MEIWNNYMYRNSFLIGLVVFVLCSCDHPEPVVLTGSVYPQVEITTDIKYDALTKTDVHCLVQLKDSIGKVKMSQNGLIKLRGNSTAVFPKRPFRLKLTYPYPICGLPEGNKWVLLANFFDKTMLRNALAFKMSEDSKLEYTPRFQYIELIYNNEYKGTYQLCEKVEVAPHRVAVPEDGWLIEIDAYVINEEGEYYFRTPNMVYPYRIEYPKDITQEKLEDLHQYFIKAEEALFSDNFTDSLQGWRKYLDEESWVDWYLIHEISKDGDGNFYTSCYMHSGSNGKIVMGPVWDFDTSFGNNIYDDPRNPKGFYTLTAPWFSQLMKDPIFAQNVKERFLFFYSNKEKYYSYVRMKANNLLPAIHNNDSIWHTIGQQISPYLEPNKSYKEDIEALIKWLDIRFEWMYKSYYS